jgi:Kef-type K+ transport system membrane component KefB
VNDDPGGTKTCPRCAEEVEEAAAVCPSCGFVFGERAAGHVPRRQFDRLAILSFVLAVVWLFGIGSLCALYVAAKSLRRTREHVEVRGRAVAWAAVAVAVLGAALAALWIGLSATA